VGTSLHEFVAGGLGRQAWTQVHGQIHGQSSPLGLIACYLAPPIFSFGGRWIPIYARDDHLAVRRYAGIRIRWSGASEAIMSRSASWLRRVMSLLDSSRSMVGLVCSAADQWSAPGEPRRKPALG
jgi:hypothetical protein